jgi:hypothetical protein
MEDWRDNKGMYVPSAFAQQSRFYAEIARAAQNLGPTVLSVSPTLGSNWNGEPAVFFTVVLTDAASRRDQILQSNNDVSNFIVQQIQPLEQWGVIPYFSFRSQSEQTRIDQHSLAT